MDGRTCALSKGERGGALSALLNFSSLSSSKVSGPKACSLVVQSSFRPRFSGPDLWRSDSKKEIPACISRRWRGGGIAGWSSLPSHCACPLSLWIAQLLARVWLRSFAKSNLSIDVALDLAVSAVFRGYLRQNEGVRDFSCQRGGTRFQLSCSQPFEEIRCITSRKH